MEPLKVIQLPERNIQDIPRALRTLADEVEQGKLGDCHNIAWVVDAGGGQIEVGLLGKAAEAGITAHYLFALGMRKLEPKMEPSI